MLDQVFKGVTKVGLLVVAAVSAAQAGSLTVRFSGLEKEGGSAMFSVANSREVFESGDQTTFAAAVPVESGEAVATFAAVPPGEYAVKVFHDEDGNQKLDIGWRGPKEGYGFSNNVMGLMSPPDFDDAKFEHTDADQVIEIKAR